MSSFQQTLQSEFFQRATVEAVLVGATAGAVGVHVLLRRLAFFVASLAHATLPGVVLASSVGFSTFVGGWAWGLLIAIAVSVFASPRVSSTNVIGVLLTGSFAIGVLLLTAGVGDTSRDFAAFLVGSILTVSDHSLITTAVVAAFTAVLVTLFHKELVFGAFDREGATANGYRVRVIDFLTLAGVTVIVVTVIPAVGTLLAVTLLTVPALTARLWCERVGPSLIVAAAVGAIGAVLGLLASALWAIAAGGAIALAITGLFLLSLGFTSAREKLRYGVSRGV